MQGLHTRVFIAAALTWFATCGHAQIREPSIEQPSPALNAVAAGESAWHASLDRSASTLAEPVIVNVPGATFIKVHFSTFHVPFGVIVEVSNPQGTEVYRYTRAYRDPHTIDRQRGDDGVYSFSAMSVSGDTAIVKIFNLDMDRDTPPWNVVIDSILHGLPSQPETGPSSHIEKALGKGSAKPEFACGAAERLDAMCWKSDYPDHYDRSRPVAKLVTARGFQCTAWRVGKENRLFTAEHCISSQEDLDGAEIWFNYEASSCDSSKNREAVKVSGNQLLATDRDLDYALFTVHDFDTIESFGNLGLDVRTGSVGENIFIPQHGLGNPRQISLESDMNLSGMCEIDDDDMYGYGKGTDIGYFCDTTTSSSGAPVISSSTGKVIALHHLGGCLNMGAKISLIWPQVKSHFGGKVPEGDSDADWAPANQVPEASYQAVCDKLSCSFNAVESVDPDGTITRYTWNFGDGSQSSGSTVEHEFSEEGQFPVELTVEDDEGAKDTMVTQVSVTSPNQEPSARFSFVCIDNSCSFDAGSSADPDGEISAWQWDMGDGSRAEGSAVEHRFEEAGSYAVKLTVTDDEGAAGKTIRNVEVQLPNVAPVARFTAICDELSCEFDAGGSTDSDGSLVSYAWALGDRTALQGNRASHRFAEDGKYRVTLTVTDNEGASTARQKTVSVSRDRVIRLSGNGRHGVKGSLASLKWKGAESADVTILRDGEALVTVGNSGRYTDRQLKHDLKSAQYQVCEAPAGICSEVITIRITQP
jgi:PKD repeat protein